MHDCYFTEKYNISIPSHQAIQAIAVVHEIKQLQNVFKRI